VASDVRREIVANALNESNQLRERILANELDRILAIGEAIAASLASGGKLVTFGNGGSAADAQHIAAELVGRFHTLERRALPAMALTTNTSTLTALGNDYGYDVVFERQVEALVQPRDVALGLSTSGNAESVLRGLAKAASAGATTVFLTGATGGRIARQLAHLDHTLRIPSTNTGRIQEVHITIGHILCALVEHALFGHT
jgi:D-sedoheptulose 7-phosphate isomerase